MTDIDLSLLPDYLVEAAEHLEEMESLLLSLAEAPEDLTLLDEIFRPIHSIKGAAQFIGLDRSSRLAHRLEDLLDLLRKGERRSSSEVVELLIAARDLIVTLADELETTQTETSSVDDMVAQITSEIEGGEAQESDLEIGINESELDLGAQNEEIKAKATPENDEALSQDGLAQAEVSATGTDDGDSYEEENDQELFGIFVENLREKIDLINTQSVEFANSPDKVALLARCAESVQGLQLAANYMGYEELTHIYTNWLEDIAAVQKALASNEDVPDDFMAGYLQEIRLLFPQLGQHGTALAAENHVAENQAAEGEAADLENELEQQLEQALEQQITAPATADESSDIDISLLPDYLIEAAEHLEEMESLLLSLAEAPEDLTLLDEIFRPIHSIKGAAQFIGLDRSSRLAHRLEDLLDLLRKGERRSSSEVVELLISARDLIVTLAEELETTQSETSSVDDMVAQITSEIEGVEAQEPATQDAETEAKAAPENTDVSSQDGPAQAKVFAATADENVVYQEENDQELFGIFIENLREKIDLINTQSVEFVNSPDKVALLARCAESVQGLQLAANYMGYEELTHIYTNWLEDIAAAQQALGRNEDVPDDFMSGYLLEIRSLFPQLGQYAESVTAQAKDNTETPIEQPESFQPDAEKTAEENLYDKLSNALDTPGSDSVGVEYELLHGVFEEMISEREDDAQEELSAEKGPELAQNTTKQPVTGSPADQSSADKASAETRAAPQQAAVNKKADAGVDTKTDTTNKTVKASKKPQQPTTAEQAKQNTAQKKQQPATSKKDEAVVKKSIRVEAEKIDSLINQVGELVVDRAYFFQLFDDMRGLQQHLKEEVGLDQKEMKQIRTFTYRMGEAIASLSRTSNDLQEGVMKVRMLPISQLFNRYPRLVHDLTRNNNKKVNLKVEGEDTELDKMVVEKLSDPLIHIIRNAIDHGLENAKDRVSAGKPEAGTLFLKSYHESNQVVVEIMDDGRGMDPNLIKTKAIEKGIVSKNEADRMLPQELIRLITTAGFSTADKITDTSGRGVGMDVVRKNIEKLNGTLEIDSRPGKGTSIRLKIPLTLAIIPAHLVRVGGNMYTIPLANIEETLRISKDETTIIEGTEVIYLRSKTLPVIHLSSLFSTSSHAPDNENFFVVVVNTGTQKIGLVVDELLGQEEVVIKPLVEYLRDKSGFSGATIIGDGSISLILDIYEIAKMTTNQQIRRQHALAMGRGSGDDASQAGQLAG